MCGSLLSASANFVEGRFGWRLILGQRPGQLRQGNRKFTTRALSCHFLAIVAGPVATATETGRDECGDALFLWRCSCSHPGHQQVRH